MRRERQRHTIVLPFLLMSGSNDPYSTDSEEKPSLPSAIVRAGLASIPVVGGAVAELFSYAEEEYRWRVHQFGTEAAQTLGDDDRFIRRLRDDPRVRDMFVDAARAARRTGWEAKRIIMGRVVARAMEEDAEIDEYAALLGALIALESVDFLYLARISSEVPMPPLSGHPVPEPYASHLIAQGVVQTGTGNMFSGAGGSEIVSVSQFGHQLLEWVRSVEGDAEG